MSSDWPRAEHGFGDTSRRPTPTARGCHRFRHRVRHLVRHLVRHRDRRPAESRPSRRPRGRRTVRRRAPPTTSRRAPRTVPRRALPTVRRRPRAKALARVVAYGLTRTGSSCGRARRVSSAGYARLVTSVRTLLDRTLGRLALVGADPCDDDDTRQREGACVDRFDLHPSTRGSEVSTRDGRRRTVCFSSGSGRVGR